MIKSALTSHQPNSTTFMGAWLVSEYVFNADGRFAGTIRQRRELEKVADGRLRVTQFCQPDDALNEHPMARFLGSPVFDLQIDGRFRRYLGPAVVGTGISWGEGAMTGRGLWPEFGHNFRSFAILPQSDCQLTGGKFFNATEMVANIAGIAAPEEAGEYPTLNLTYHPTTASWKGTINTTLADGTILEERPWQRNFQTVTEDNIVWEEEAATISLKKEDGRFRCQNGVAKLYGPLLEIELVTENGRLCEQLELLDSIRGHLVSLRRWFQNNQLEKIEVIRLKPETERVNDV